MELEVHDHWIFFTNFWFDDIFTQAINMKCAAFKQYNLWFSDRNDLSTLSGKKTCQTSMCIFCCYHLTILNILRVRFCLTSNRRTFFFPGTENLNFGNFKAALASQGWPSCPYKPLSIRSLKQLNFYAVFSRQNSNFQIQGR